MREDEEARAAEYRQTRRRWRAKTRARIRAMRGDPAAAAAVRDGWAAITDRQPPDVPGRPKTKPTIN